MFRGFRGLASRVRRVQICGISTGSEYPNVVASGLNWFLGSKIWRLSTLGIEWLEVFFRAVSSVQIDGGSSIHDLLLVCRKNNCSI